MKFSEHKKALAHLKKDPILRKIIKEYQIEELDGETDVFQDLIESIINQQLSGKAAATIFGRFKSLFKRKTFPAPQQILKVSDEEIRKCGISFSKIKYIKGLCQSIIKKELNIKKLTELSDEEVIVELTKIKGIGKWTAEMILIFSLKRLDVFSAGDLGLRTAVSRLYKREFESSALKRKFSSSAYKVQREDKKKIEEISKRWSPYKSLAARLLWRSLDNRD